ncbi:hypothetical protein ACHHYP_09452 [Achlya hypogyna]|uniref:Uncharacterized protein n=1 Tax=Achlya hypogyna TaxID=1202772 RepID=A0A1V9ZIV2_ACHHY|nr:hypothetical protein ACHHYP_09452 [Achlya hypogyna]
MSDCTHELEDLLLEVFESLEAAGDELVLPEYVARKLHGMVHLHRACSHRWSADNFVDTSCLECGEARSSNQEEATLASCDEVPMPEVKTEVVLARPELVVEGVPAWISMTKQSEHPELVIECDDDDEVDLDSRAEWPLPSGQEHPEIVIELEEPASTSHPEIVIALDSVELPVPCEHPELIIELDTAPATETSDATEGNDHVEQMPSPSFVPLPVIVEEETDASSVVSTLDLLEPLGKPLMVPSVPVAPQSPETQSMHSDDETVTSIDLDLEHLQSLNNEYDEFFEFMNHELESDVPSSSSSSAPQFDDESATSSDDDSDYNQPVHVLRSPVKTPVPAPSPAPIALAEAPAKVIKPTAIPRPKLEIALPREHSATTPRVLARKSSSPTLTARVPPPIDRKASSPMLTCRRAGALPPPLSVDRKASPMLSSSRSSVIPPPPMSVDRKILAQRRAAPRDSHGSNASTDSKSSTSTASLKRTASAPRLTTRSPSVQCPSVTTTRGTTATPKKPTAATPRSAPTPRKAAVTTTAPATTPRSADSRHEMAARRREEKEKREAALREEAARSREERRQQLEARQQAERAARAELVRKRQLERDDHLKRATPV